VRCVQILMMPSPHKLTCVVGAIFASLAIGQWAQGNPPATTQSTAATTSPTTEPVADILKSVKNMRVEYKDSSLDRFPDYVYLLRAKISPQQWDLIKREAAGTWSVAGHSWEMWDWKESE